MQENENLPASGFRIQKDKMHLAVTAARPDFHKKSEEETRREISAKLYRIFQTYGKKGTMQNV